MVSHKKVLTDTEPAGSAGSGVGAGSADSAQSVGSAAAEFPSKQAEPLSSALSAATSHLPAPLSVVDIRAFDHNARAMATRAHGKPIRIATKSVRNRALLDRALAMPGYRGLMCYSLREALWLVSLGYSDILVAYPTVDRGALEQLARDERALAEIVLMVDSTEHFELLDSLGSVRPVRVALDIDSSLRVFSRAKNPIHVGVRRSRLYQPGDVTQFAGVAEDFRRVRIVGAMFYDAQIAGLPDKSFIVRAMKSVSRVELAQRRREVTAALAAVAGPLELVNAGGTGSLGDFAEAHEVTEVTAGSGLYMPTLFDGYRGLGLRPSAYFGLDVVRAPRPNIITAFAGGYMASGEVAVSRQPRLLDRSFSLTSTEGVGEVQTPIRVRRGAVAPQVGDRVWLRHAKAGEQMERFNITHIFDGSQIVDETVTYRGEGQNFG